MFKEMSKEKATSHARIEWAEERERGRTAADRPWSTPITVGMA